MSRNGKPKTRYQRRCYMCRKTERLEYRKAFGVDVCQGCTGPFLALPEGTDKDRRYAEAD